MIILRILCFWPGPSTPHRYALRPPSAPMPSSTPMGTATVPLLQCENALPCHFNAHYRQPACVSGWSWCVCMRMQQVVHCAARSAG